MQSTRFLRLLSSALMLGAFVVTPVAGCQVALRAEGDDPRCSVEGLDCGNGLTCQQGVCRPAPACIYQGPEKCNGIDDDCNGEVDDGFDKDGDGFKTCGEAGKIDCNDDPDTGKDVHPGVAEICNGFDDNCDGKTDEEPNDCSAKGEECWSDKGKCVVKGDCRLHGCDTGGCDPTTGKCTAPDCRITKSCPPGQTCDPTSGVCVQTMNPGDSCDSTTPCKAGYSCIDLTPLELGKTGSVCAKACCDSSTCDPGFTCKTSKAGASLCMKIADGVAVGSGLGNAKCGTGAECRSGVCAGGFCQDGCCGSIGCGAGGTCSIKGDNAFACRTPVGTKGVGQGCSSDSDCQSGWCNDKIVILGGLCTKKCCSSEDCPLGSICQTYKVGVNIVSACRLADSTPGSKRPGESCGSDGDCRSTSCVDNQCYDNCCRDSDCANGTVCRPRNIGSGAYPLRCVKK